MLIPGHAHTVQNQDRDTNFQNVVADKFYSAPPRCTLVSVCHLFSHGEKLDTHQYVTFSIGEEDKHVLQHQSLASALFGNIMVGEAEFGK